MLFIGPFAVYCSDFFASIGVRAGEHALGMAHPLTGAWLTYLTYTTLADFSLGWQWRV